MFLDDIKVCETNERETIAEEMHNQMEIAKYYVDGRINFSGESKTAVIASVLFWLKSQRWNGRANW